MIIVDANKKEIVFSQSLETINIHSNKTQINATKMIMGRPDSVLGKYENANKCKIAFIQLIQAIKNNDLVFEMPSDKDLTETVLVKDTRNVMMRTNGKTK